MKKQDRITVATIAKGFSEISKHLLKMNDIGNNPARNELQLDCNLDQLNAHFLDVCQTRDQMIPFFKMILPDIEKGLKEIYNIK